MKTFKVKVTGKVDFEKSFYHLPKTIFHKLTNNSEKWHNNDNCYRNYTISFFENGLDICKPNVYLNDATMLITTKDDELIELLENVDTSKIKIDGVSKITMSGGYENYYGKKLTRDNFIVVKTLSPIILPHNEKEKLSKDYSNFIELLTITMKRKFNQLGIDKDSINTFEITYNEFNEDRTPNITNEKTIKPLSHWFKGYKRKGGFGTLMIKGDRVILKSCLENGLGITTGCGFGSIKVIA